MKLFSVKLWLSLLAASLPALVVPAAPRVWTAADGRTIDADYVGRAEDGESLVLVRSDTKTRVTVPLSALSKQDREFAEKLPRERAPSLVQSQVASKSVESGISEAGRALCRSVPRQMVPQYYLGAWDPNRPECVQMHDAYTRLIGSIPSGNPAANIRAVRIRLERDLRDNTPLAATSTSSGRAAACNVYWLRGVVAALLDQIEAELSK